MKMPIKFCKCCDNQLHPDKSEKPWEFKKHVFCDGCKADRVVRLMERETGK